MLVDLVYIQHGKEGNTVSTWFYTGENEVLELQRSNKSKTGENNRDKKKTFKDGFCFVANGITFD